MGGFLWVVVSEVVVEVKCCIVFVSVIGYGADSCGCVAEVLGP